MQPHVNKLSLQQTYYTSNSKSISKSKKCLFQSFQPLHIFKCTCLSHSMAGVEKNATKYIHHFSLLLSAASKQTHPQDRKQKGFSASHPDDETGPTRTRRRKSNIVKCSHYYLGFYLALCTQRTKSFLLYLQANTFPFHFYCIYGSFKF